MRSSTLTRGTGAATAPAAKAAAGATTTKAVTATATIIADQAATIATQAETAATTHGTGWWWWCIASMPGVARWRDIDDNVLGLHPAHMLCLLACKDHIQVGNLLVECFARVDARAVCPVGIQGRAAKLPHKYNMGLGVARKRELILTSFQPHVVEVSANVICDDVDSLKNAQDDVGCIPVAQVELDLGPIGGIEESVVHMCLEEEQSPIFVKCHAEVVLVKT